ncbi:amidohydrolase family protein [Thalassotalea euphylliae]|uniref:amidohydrolase family protein n=1 Tax=Thalassotalea euphylliae TaxID=1655234 RepID=UPI0036421F07
MNIIDPHVHLFDLSQGKYLWLKPENPPLWPDKAIIAKDFSQQDLSVDKPYQVAGFVHIEAGFDNEQPWREIQWLESTVLMPFKSVATIDISQDIKQVHEAVLKLKEYKSVVGVRHILDDDAHHIMSDPDFADKLDMLGYYDLHFELQMPISDLTSIHLLTTALEQAPNTRVIVNHAGWPKEALAQDITWQQGMKQLAALPTIAMKCSGWEMTNRTYEFEWARQTIDFAISCFGAHRVMLASNFPLCLFSHSYQSVWNTYCQSLADTSLLQQICFDNAYHWYGFNS